MLQILILTILNFHLLTARKTFTLDLIGNIFLFKNRKRQQKKNEYQYLYTKDGELRGNNITDENEGGVVFGNDFIICKIIHHKD